VPAGNHRQLVEILAAQQFKGFDCGRVWGNDSQTRQRTHHALHAGLRPVVASDCFNLVHCNQSRDLVILDHNEAAVSGFQYILVDKILQAETALNGRVVAIHNVRNTPSPQSCHQLHLNVTGTSGIQQKPTDKGEP
jgi:hypothetical protein